MQIGAMNGQRLTEIMRQAQVDEDGKLNDRDQYERQAQALFNQQAIMTKIAMIDTALTTWKSWFGGFDHVLHAGGFADQHTAGIVFL